LISVTRSVSGEGSLLFSVCVALSSPPQTMSVLLLRNWWTSTAITFSP
jgi:hypothetical protein